MGQINDVEYAYLVSLGINPTQINDMWYEYYNPAITSYDVVLYGDSQVDPPATSTVDPIGWGMHLFTTLPVTYDDRASGGWRLDQIRALFDTSFPVAGTNTDFIQGGINDITQDRDLALMIEDAYYMIDKSLSLGRFCIFVGISPMGLLHPLYTAARAQKILDFNANMAFYRKHQYVNIYDSLKDPLESLDLDVAYRKSTTDLHLSDNGCRAADYCIGSKLVRIIQSLVPNAGNTFPSPRDMTALDLVNCTIGGPSIRLADGTYSSEKGILGSDILSTLKQVRLSYTAVPDNSDVIVSVLLRPGQFKWVRMSFTDNTGAQITRYVNILDLTQGTGTGNWVPTLYAMGWVKVELAVNVGVGVSVNNINVRPATGDGANNTTAIDVLQPLMYIDLLQTYVV